MARTLTERQRRFCMEWSNVLADSVAAMWDAGLPMAVWIANAENADWSASIARRGYAETDNGLTVGLNYSKTDADREAALL